MVSDPPTRCNVKARRTSPIRHHLHGRTQFGRRPSWGETAALLVLHILIRAYTCYPQWVGQWLMFAFKLFSLCWLDKVKRWSKFWFKSLYISGSRICSVDVPGWFKFASLLKNWTRLNSCTLSFHSNSLAYTGCLYHPTFIPNDSLLFGKPLKKKRPSRKCTHNLVNSRKA